MSEKIPYQPTPEASNSNKEIWLKELNSKKTRELILDYIFSMKMGFSPEDAEDITQQVMFKAATAIKNDQFRGDSKLATWLHIITKNTTLNLLRTKKSQRYYQMTPIFNAPKLTGDAPTSVESYIAAEEAKNLRSLFNKLRPKQREVMELLADDLDNKQIAQRMGIKVSAVAKLASRAIKFLRELAEEEEEDKK